MENKPSLQERLTDFRYLPYFSLLMLSVLVFFISDAFPNTYGDHAFTYFLFHAGLAILCLFGSLTFSRESPTRKDVRTIFWLLALVSCYALNREIRVFNTPTPWLCALLLTTGAALLLLRYADLMPRWAKALTGLATGVACVLYFYFALCLASLYVYGLFALVLLGLGFHVFVPAFLLYHTISAIRRLHLGKPALTGAALSLIIIIGFAVQYSSTVYRINRTYHRTTAENGSDLPVWAETTRQLRPGFITESVLQTGLKYASKGMLEDLFDWTPPRRFYNGLVCHDPLVDIATACAPPLALGLEERVQVLNALYDGRHDTQERLWSGDQLSTSYVHTKVKLWPEIHLAYTEKTLTVHNESHLRTGEAIYTFQLPEGGVVTSLSLWINGKEEKAVLTTKEKADSAYQTIVGVEERDPSVVRWQEGNTVSVRVFPVPPEDSRVFRIGVSAPLKMENGKMVYENIPFKGPASGNATEYASIENEGSKLVARKVPGFSRNGTLLEREGAYRPDWRIEMEALPLRPRSFSFNGYAYTIEPFETQRSSVSTSAIYLDVNQSWTYGDVRRIISMAGNIPVYAFVNDNKVELPDSGFHGLIKPLQEHRFSLFPFHRVPDPEGALVVTKNNGISPMLTDLQGSGFHQKLAQKLADSTYPKIRLFDFGERLSPYLESLRAARAFRYEKGTQDQLRELINRGIFATDAESANKVVIHEAQAAITRAADSTSGGTGPDHIMRLFAYNHILQQTGKGLITGSAGQEQLVAAAKEAYVVSPVSSLVVLETQADYDRFGIHDEGDSLKNASLNDNGAVPEPHEWALIIIAVLSVYLYLNRRRWTVFNA